VADAALIYGLHAVRGWDLRGGGGCRGVELRGVHGG
jgi:hypothetical protein